MTSKVKATSSDKNIDIQINIENNLFSKNKCDGVGKKKNDYTPTIQTRLGEQVPEDIAGAVAGEAEKRFYRAIQPMGYSLGTWKNRFLQMRNDSKPVKDEPVDDPIEEDDEEPEEEEAGTSPPASPAAIASPVGAVASPVAEVPIETIVKRRFIFEENLAEARYFRRKYAEKNEIPISSISNKNPSIKRRYKEWLEAIKESY